MAPLSDDPDKRKRQLQNLPNLRGEAPASSFRRGSAPHLRHGLRSRATSPLVLDPIAREIEDALGDDLPLKDPDGEVPAADRLMVELAAQALLRVRRCAAYLELHGDVDENGTLRPELDGLGRAIEHAAKMLDRLGCSPRSRAALGVDVGRMQTFDLARHWADEHGGSGA